MNDYTKDYTDLVEFSNEGLPLGKDTKTMSYLYGLSDFWAYMFEDASKVNLLLETNALMASEIYNRFLQLSSQISLEDISILSNSQLTLVLISDEDNRLTEGTPVSGKVNGKVETYYLPNSGKLKYAKHFANRALLPTETLDDGTDYYIDQELGQITFSQPLNGMSFPARILANGSKQYALWAIDAKVDESLIYEKYAKRIGVNPTNSTQLFKDFVYGMYYLYINGPNLETIRKGLNITLGIPLARDPETVLEIRLYPNTDQYLVITDLNSYLIPYGLTPTVSVGDTLATGDEISSWIEVKDYQNDGEWWANFMLPKHILPDVPPSVPGGGSVVPDSVPDRYMTAGSYADWLMRNYLKKHTFLVNVKTINFKNIQSFEQLAEIIHQVKPSYTTPIYVWTVPVPDEEIIIEDHFDLSIGHDLCEPVLDGTYRFHRDSNEPLIRCCCPDFTRMSAPAFLNDQTGYNVQINGHPRAYDGGRVNGYISPMRTYREFTPRENAWDRTLRTRGQEQFITLRGKLDYRRLGTNEGQGYGVNPYRNVYPEKRMVYLFTTTLRDIQEKLLTLNVAFDPDTYVTEVLKPTSENDSIVKKDFVLSNFAYLFTKGTNGSYLGRLAPTDSYREWAPLLADFKTGDFFTYVNIGTSNFGVYWVTSNFDVETPGYWARNPSEAPSIRMTGKPTRGSLPHGSSFYALRGAGREISYNTSDSIDSLAINTFPDPESETVVVFEDDSNPLFLVDRSGQTLITDRTWN